MTTTFDAVRGKKKSDLFAAETAAKDLARLARRVGLVPDRSGRVLLEQFTKTVWETALNEEITEYLGHEKH